MNGLTVGQADSGISERIVSPVSMPWVTLAPAAHHAVLSSETSISTASPVRSRWNSAAEMPPAMFIPPIESPNAGMPCDSAPPELRGGQRVARRRCASRTPCRRSRRPSRSAPLSPYALPRA